MNAQGRDGPAAPLGLNPVFLKPGDLFLTDEPCRVTTVLGSCVAVTLFSQRAKRSAICHGSLPEPKRAGAGDSTGRFKYISMAIPFMVAWFRKHGVSPREIEAKIFGGASHIGHEHCPHEHCEHNHPGVSEANISRALQLLREEEIPIKSGNVGGSSGRKIIFNTQTGEVLHRFL